MKVPQADESRDAQKEGIDPRNRNHNRLPKRSCEAHKRGIGLLPLPNAGTAMGGKHWVGMAKWPRHS